MMQADVTRFAAGALRNAAVSATLRFLQLFVIAFSFNMFFAFFFNVSLACMFSLMISVYRHAIIHFLVSDTGSTFWPDMKSSLFYRLHHMPINFLLLIVLSAGCLQLRRSENARACSSSSSQFVVSLAPADTARVPQT
jgi:hypothetical protein